MVTHRPSHEEDRNVPVHKRTQPKTPVSTRPEDLAAHSERMKERERTRAEADPKDVDRFEAALGSPPEPDDTEDDGLPSKPS